MDKGWSVSQQVRCYYCNIQGTDRKLQSENNYQQKAAVLKTKINIQSDWSSLFQHCRLYQWSCSDGCHANTFGNQGASYSLVAFTHACSDIKSSNQNKAPYIIIQAGLDDRYFVTYGKVA